MLDHDIRSYKLIARVFDGQTEGLTRDDILDNVTLYWLTNTAVSSARLYWDTTQISNGAGFFDVRGVKIPVAVSAFPDEIYAGAAELGGEGLPEADPLQQARQGRPLRRLGTAGSSSPPSCGRRSGRCARRSEASGAAPLPRLLPEARTGFPPPGRAPQTQT